MKVLSRQDSFQWSEGFCGERYQKIESGELSMAELSQEEAFELIQWVIINRPASEFLLDLRQNHFTQAQERAIHRLEKSYQTPLRPEQLPYRGYSPSPPPSEIDFSDVRRRLFVDEDEEEEMKPDCSIFKFALVLAGIYVIYSVVVKPIFKQIGEFFQKDVGLKV